MIEKIKKRLDRTSTAFWLSISVIYVSLVAYASAANFKAGYLRYFGVDIRHIDYWPSIADFMNQPIVVLLAIIILLATYVAVVLIINGTHWALQRIAKKKKWKRLLKLIDEKPFGRKMIAGTLIVLFLFLSFKLPLFDSSDRGFEFAEQQKNFTVLASEDTPNQALIYQYSGIGIVKTYNQETKSFEKSYNAIDIAGNTFEAVQLIRD